MSSTDDDVLERKVLTPEPGLVKSLGAHHSLESAVADLVDNSVDAGATRVLITFETENGEPVGLTVVDNGRGMDGIQVDEAMRLGARRDYAQNSQGHFGIGLKAASFSHANVLTVCTSPRSGEYHGRRLIKADVERDYSCDVLAPSRAAGELTRRLALFEASAGTVIRWSDTHFPRATGAGVEEWMHRSRTRLRMHLGVIYHRFLSEKRVRIDIEVYDAAVGESGAPETVVPIDPFGFPTAAVADYPKTLVATVDGISVSLECHIVPPKSSGPSFRLYGRDGAEAQGFYIYRSDRLLQVGGWNDVISTDKNRSLARVVIDDYDSLSPLVQMVPEKSGIAFRPGLGAAITAATTADATALSFLDYVARAEAVLVESRKRKRSRSPIAEPSRGLHEEIRRVIRAEVPLRTDEGPVEIRWRRMPRDKFLELEREERVIYLNQHYREMLTGGKTGLSDAPLLKTLVFLMTQEHFMGRHWGSKDKDLIDMWDSVLGAAVQTEYEYRTASRRR